MIRSLSSVVAVSLLAILPASAEDGLWNRFRGPNGSGISNAKTVPVSWTEKDYNWKIELPGPGHSSPVVWENRIFVTCGDPTTALRTLLCVDASTGRMLWKQEEPSKTYDQHRDNSYATATPAVDAGGVVITWSTPEAVMLLALDLEGKELWRRNLGPLISLQGSGSSPILYQDMVVLANDQEDMERSPGRKPDGPNPVGRSFVIAVDRKTGQTRWETETKTYFAGYSTPCVYQAEEGRAELIFSTTAHGILAIDPATGKINWEFGEPFLDRAVISPVVGAGPGDCGARGGDPRTRCIAVRPGSAETSRPAHIGLRAHHGHPHGAHAAGQGRAAVSLVRRRSAVLPASGHRRAGLAGAGRWSLLCLARLGRRPSLQRLEEGRGGCRGRRGQVRGSASHFAGRAELMPRPRWPVASCTCGPVLTCSRSAAHVSGGPHDHLGFPSGSGCWTPGSTPFVAYRRVPTESQCLGSEQQDSKPTAQPFDRTCSLIRWMWPRPRAFTSQPSSK